MPTNAATFSTATLAELERRLHHERQRLTTMASTARLDLQVAADDLDLSDLLDGDTPDGGSVDGDRHRASAVVAMATGRLLDVDAALERLRQGDYGWCCDCGDRIALARLRTLPAAARCAACQAGADWPFRVAS
jgi:RNA polymerase-binding transcription factor DksA